LHPPIDYGEVVIMSSVKLLLLLPLAFILASCSRDPKVQAQRYLENGNKFYNKTKYKEASIMYRRALQKDLRFGEAYYRLGLAEWKLAAFGDAARAFRRAFELQPKNVDAAAKLADLYMIGSTQDPINSRRMLSEAHELTDRILELDANSYEGHRLAGQLALIENDPAKAAAELGAAYRIQPDDALATAYFRALVSNKQMAQAEALAREVIARSKDFAPMYDVLYSTYMTANRIADASEVMKEKVANNPTQGTFLLQLAAHYYVTKQQAEFEQAIQRLGDEKAFPDGHMLAGDFFFFRARNFERARQQYDAGVRAFPSDHAAYQKRIVELLATQGRNQEANEVIATLLMESPNDSDAIAMRAALMLQTGNRDQVNQATNDLQALVTKNSENHLLRYNLARALLAKGDVEQARLQLEAAIKIRPDFIIAREMLARVYLAKGDYAKALKEADDTIALNSRDLPAHLIRSSALIGIGEKDKAREEIALIDRLAPDNPDARYQAGYLAWDSKDFKRAEQLFGELYRSNPKDPRGLMGIVETLASQNQLPQAIKQLEEVIAKEPERRDLRLALANLYVRDQRYDDAIAIYQFLLKSDPKSGDLLYRLGETQRRKGDVNTAIETFRRAGQAVPSDPRPLLQLGLLMDGTGRREQAKPLYEQILKIQPDHPIALNNLAFIKAEEGIDLDEALSMAQRARQKMPDSTYIKDTLGWIYIKKNLSEDAVRTFKDLIKEDPNNPSFRYHYGMALLQKGDKPSARRELEAALKNNPSKDDANKIRQLLAAN
jgi:tetratricopeptide (TPR) repeat protein